MSKTKKTLGGLVAVVVLLALVAPAAALAGPELELNVSHLPPTAPVPVGTSAIYEIGVSNVGDERTTGAGEPTLPGEPPTENVTVNFTAPDGFEITGAFMQTPLGYLMWECSVTDSRSASCDGPKYSYYENEKHEKEFAGNEPSPIYPGEEACEAEFGKTCRLRITLRAQADAPIGPAESPLITACGGGDTTCPAVAATALGDPLEIVPFEFQIAKLDQSNLQEDGSLANQAGSHPYSNVTEFFGNTFLGTNGFEYNTQDLKDVITHVPPGLVGNPLAADTCTQVQLAQGQNPACPPDSQVGTVLIEQNGNLGQPGKPGHSFDVPVYNMEVPFGLPGLFAFRYTGNITQVYASVRTGGDYGIDVTVKNAPETIPIAGSIFTFWGIPADPSHDALRRGVGCEKGCAFSGPIKPFLTLPTSCTGPMTTSMTITGWLGAEASATTTSHNDVEEIGNEGCNSVDFSPTLQARPTTNVADSPSGLDVDLHIPQHEACDPGPPVTCETAEAHLRDAAVTLPEGMVINPAGANGLDGCSPAEVDLHGTGTAHCPDASKQGTVQVDTPLLDHPLMGGVYLADPYDNPFNSLLAIYIAVEDPKTGVIIKLAGEVQADPVTGRLTATFKDNPQQPFEDFQLHFFGGAGGALRTPSACGTYSTTSELTPWTAPDSGPPATPSDTWAISQAPGGGACPTSNGAQPNSPDLDAGTVSPIAGSFSPMVINLRREDGTQQFSTITLSPPPGLIGRLAGTPSCSEAELAAAASKTGRQEKASPSCPAASDLGSATVGAGAGPAPYYAAGRVYLAGPYKGAPLSLAIVTPATAGPFDLGTVVVRTALRINSETTQITAISDPIPSILQGIPLDVRSAQIRLDKPQFTLNPTSCNPLAFSGQLASTLGSIAPLSERFQVGECGRLGFKPKLGLRLSGGTGRGAHPALRAVLQMPAGGANIAKASVALPRSEFLDQSHIGTVCTRVQFAAEQCPAASVYGSAIATSPLVDYALQGPVYLRSSNNKLPDLVMALHGPASQPIEIDAVGRIDSVKGGIRSSFEAVPDAPVSSLVLSMTGGKKGLLQNSTNICEGAHRATAVFEAQNGIVSELRPALKARCAKKKSAKKKHHAGRGAKG